MPYLEITKQTGKMDKVECFIGALKLVCITVKLETSIVSEAAFAIVLFPAHCHDSYDMACEQLGLQKKYLTKVLL